MTIEQIFITVAIAALCFAAVLIGLFIAQFLRVRRRVTAAQKELDLSHVKPIDLDGARLFRSIARNTCPDCKAFGFYGGPRGGAGQNIYCVNPECRAAFNVTFFTPTDGKVERIPNKPKEWYNGDL